MIRVCNDQPAEAAKLALCNDQPQRPQNSPIAMINLPTFPNHINCNDQPHSHKNKHSLTHVHRAVTRGRVLTTAHLPLTAATSGYSCLHNDCSRLMAVEQCCPTKSACLQRLLSLLDVPFSQRFVWVGCCRGFGWRGVRAINHHGCTSLCQPSPFVAWRHPPEARPQVCVPVHQHPHHHRNINALANARLGCAVPQGMCVSRGEGATPSVSLLPL